MKFAGGGVVRHLGLQNYKGAVPALAELISNSWDADAHEVFVKIPLDSEITQRDIISIMDDGCGMNWSDCDRKYLVIGRNRREADKTDKTDGGRPLMAHKGLGKLAGFGIANVVEVKTIKKNKLTHFVMDFSSIDKLNQGETYKPRMIADEEDTELENGTEVILKDLNLQRAIPHTRFFRSMMSRFAILSDEFKVCINDIPLKKEQIPLEFRFPDKTEDDVIRIVEGWGYTNLPPEIKWWIGFTEKPIQIEDVQGVSVLTRGKISQEPWDFGATIGASGQYGLRYITGEIVADFLDEGLAKEDDLIITNRSGVMWEHEKAMPLFDWAQKKIRHLLREWSKRRSERTVKEVKRKHPELVKMIDQFQPRERRELNSAMKKLAEVQTIEPERLVTIFGFVIDGYRDKAFVDVLEDIKNMPPEDQIKTLEILKEFDVLEAIRVHKIVSSHVRVIRTFRDMIDAGVPEKPDMHEHIRKYPWLLGIKYQSMDYEKSLQKILETHFKVGSNDKEGKKRPDFVCMRSGGDVLVIELKRALEKAGLKELHQISGYVDYLREWTGRGNSANQLGRSIQPDDIEGYLIVFEYQDVPQVRREIKRLIDDKIFPCKWYDVLRRTEDDYMDYLQIVKGRAPKDDPRVRELEERKIL